MRADCCDFNDLIFNEKISSITTRRGSFASSLSVPISSKDLRLMIGVEKSSPIIILPESISSNHLPMNNPKQQRTKTDEKKKKKRSRFDVYRTLIRSETHSSVPFDQDRTHNDNEFLTGSFTIDRISPISTHRNPRSRSLPKVHKSNNVSEQFSDSKTKSFCSSFDFVKPTPPSRFHCTTPVNTIEDQFYDELTVTEIFEFPPRKSLDIFLP